MNKNTLMAAVGAAAIVLVATVYAQATPPAAPAPQMEKSQEAETFDAHKQRLLKKIGEHIDKMQKTQSCYNAATDEKALSACLSGGKKAPSSPAKQ